MTSLLAGFGAGLLAWTLLEYAIHYWLGHLPRGRILISAEHLKHHRDILYFSPIALKVRGAIPVLAVLFAGVGWLFGLAAGVGFVSAVCVGWTLYEWIHQSIHVRGPATAYTRWVARRHLHHHFDQPNANHGVTSPIWDLVFRTWAPAQRVRVPRRSLASVPWLARAEADSRGAEPLAGAYEITGRGAVNTPSPRW